MVLLKASGWLQSEFQNVIRGERTGTTLFLQKKIKIIPSEKMALHYLSKGLLIFLHVNIEHRLTILEFRSIQNQLSKIGIR